MKVNKYDPVFDMIDHPENYSSEEQAEILADPEAREVYNLLCKVDTAVEYHKGIDPDAEWAKFTQKHPYVHRRSLFVSRAAIISAIAGTSLVAVATGIALTYTLSVEKTDVQPVSTVSFDDTTAIVDVNLLSAGNDSLLAKEPIVFEDESLETIISAISSAYSVSAIFNNEDVASLHLYYKLDTSLSLDEVIAQLNTFEQIDIKQNGNTLTID